MSRLVDATGATLRMHVEPHQVEVRRIPATPRGQLVRRNRLTVGTDQELVALAHVAPGQDLVQA